MAAGQFLELFVVLTHAVVEMHYALCLGALAVAAILSRVEETSKPLMGSETAVVLSQVVLSSKTTVSLRDAVGD